MINFNVKENMFHQPPMLLVDNILEESANSGKASFLIKKDCIFLDSERTVLRAALIEMAAQALSAVDAYQRKRDKKPSLKGFLVGVKNFKFYGDAKENDTVICAIDKCDELAGMHIVKALIYANGLAIARGELRIFEIADGKP
jgi:predicted hotdog family 3-hydroxylacyl-ACP dehydratase